MLLTTTGAPVFRMPKVFFDKYRPQYHLHFIYMYKIADAERFVLLGAVSPDDEDATGRAMMLIRRYLREERVSIDVVSGSEVQIL